jgi:hypothetical protein
VVHENFGGVREIWVVHEKFGVQEIWGVYEKFGGVSV